jgi:hypothetical protein
MNSKGAKTLALAVVEYALSQFPIEYPKNGRYSNNKRVMVPLPAERIKKAILSRTEKNRIRFLARHRFLAKGKMVDMVADALEFEPQKFRKNCLKKLNENYRKSIGLLEEADRNFLE